MYIGVLSGKGGTGKTTVSTNLASLLKASYIDCDVEAPNGFLFLNPNIEERQDVEVEIPLIDNEKCVKCGNCAENCLFNALVNTKNDIILFQELCHSCGACKIACNYDALTYKKRSIGVIEKGKINNINLKRGLLNIKEPIAVPIVKELLKNKEEQFCIVDFPPGTSCTVVNCLDYIDAAILVTEPTQFGLHDLKLAVEIVKRGSIPFGVVINKDIEEEKIIDDYCRQENINIIGKIPLDRKIADLYSNGKMLIEDEGIKKFFLDIASNAEEMFKWN